MNQFLYIQYSLQLSLVQEEGVATKSKSGSFRGVFFSKSGEKPVLFGGCGVLDYAE